MEINVKRGYLLEDFRIFHSYNGLDVKVGPHYHEFHKIFMLCSGNGSYDVEGRRYNLKPGDTVFVGAGKVHCPDFGSDPYERIIFYISPAHLEAHSDKNCDLQRCFSGEGGHVLRPEGGTAGRLFTLAADIEKESGGTGTGHGILARCVFLQFMVEIAREMEKTDIQMLPPIEPKDKKVLEIMRYIDAHYSEDISVDELSGMFYMSRYHMMRRFKEELGTTIHAYISEKRLLMAKDLIRAGVSAADACHRSGFGSYSSFSRAYSKLFGNTPTGRRGEEPFVQE